MPTANEAMQELLEMSASIRHAVLVRGEKQVMASTFANRQSGERWWRWRERMRKSPHVGERDGPSALTQVFVEPSRARVFIVTGEKDTWLAASTGTDPTAGLVLYDVNTALRTLEAEADEERLEEMRMAGKIFFGFLISIASTLGITGKSAASRESNSTLTMAPCWPSTAKAQVVAKRPQWVMNWSRSPGRTPGSQFLRLSLKVTTFHLASAPESGLGQE